MARDGKVEQLAKVSLFRGLSHKELQAVAAAADIVAVPADNDVVVEGTPGHDFYLILNGTASVRRDGHEVATLGPGESFGELALLTHAPRNATVVAATDTELLVIGQRQFHAVLDTVPAMAYKLLVTMAERLAALDRHASSH
ncbi:cyclic nucleotide-binding domain-containing protein [Acidiferrimicrobium sp. IK]|uniref:cyclic nucleotide-binding domain-containing protein n=1 Tax=Acidiferrimicrobium sp. IK TaxID=2871700 RepID=UPI0021CB8B8E|nr:cyclic nucleotide-binding domain-containing protein [Acidiferrimicrobium sp. IK]MCU4182942.1 cyclic nucleotide-binding domain-containing protein [Acidiferrimicrobium sp. IK]